MYVLKVRFLIDDWRVFMQYVVPGGGGRGKGLFNGFHMESGHHQTDITYPDQQFLGFSWPLDLSTARFFCSNVLPFGLSSAPFLSTKFFSPLVRHWRAQSFHFVLHLDDGVICPLLDPLLRLLALI